MESSSLTQAYDHAKAASVATHSSDTTVAISEHTLAAGEFSRAASGSSSAEALRTLKLLEQHHRRLSELLRFPNGSAPSVTTDAEVHAIKEKPLSTSAAVAELRISRSDLGPVRSSSPLRNPPSLSHPRRLPPRDLSSSIASNLASARGIRTNYTRQPLSPSVSKQQAPGSVEALPRGIDKQIKIPVVTERPKPTWLPPATSRIDDMSALTPTSEDQTVANHDEGFSRFYNTFENILSKLSAPLAFAGLPLRPEEAPDVPVPDTRLIPKRVGMSSRDGPGSDPDLSKYISRAALRASARDGQSGNDSFYVVPTTGHTVSYAHILSFDQKEKRRLAASIHSENPDLFTEPGEEEDFVDARENPMPSTPHLSRDNSRKINGKDLENKVEELDIENKSLKDCIDKLSQRLHTFEMSAQQNSMALAESMRLMRDLSPAKGIRGGEEALKRRVLELEEHTQLSGKEIERLGRENEKLKNVVQRYRERWEKLKEGAKMRREGSEAGAVKATGDSAAA